MPWIKDINNEKKYIPSIFVKEELPTWNELYEDFWLGRVYDYDKTECTEYAKYWNIPIRLFILGTTCNQLNKMILENEDIKKFIIDKFNESNYFSKLRYDDMAYFSLDPIENEISSNTIVEDFTIYNIPNPNGNDNPFITTYENRTNIKDLGSVKLVLVFKSIKSIIIDKLDISNNTFKEILTEMMKPVIEYFEGDKIGWKDENGNVIGNKSDSTKCLSGYDPAL